MLSRDIIRQNLAGLHAHEARRARWVWAGVVVIGIAAAVITYRALAGI